MTQLVPRRGDPETAAGAVRSLDRFARDDDVGPPNRSTL